MLDGNVLATIGLSYFSSSMPKAKAIAAYVPPLMDLAKNIESSVAALHAQFTDERSPVREEAKKPQRVAAAL